MQKNTRREPKMSPIQPILNCRTPGDVVAPVVSQAEVTHRELKEKSLSLCPRYGLRESNQAGHNGHCQPYPVVTERGYPSHGNPFGCITHSQEAAPNALFLPRGQRRWIEFYKKAGFLISLDNFFSPCKNISDAPSPKVLELPGP